MFAESCASGYGLFVVNGDSWRRSAKSPTRCSPRARATRRANDDRSHCHRSAGALQCDARPARRRHHHRQTQHCPGRPFLRALVDRVRQRGELRVVAEPFCTPRSIVSRGPRCTQRHRPAPRRHANTRPEPRPSGRLRVPPRTRRRSHRRRASRPYPLLRPIVRGRLALVDAADHELPNVSTRPVRRGRARRRHRQLSHSRHRLPGARPHSAHGRSPVRPTSLAAQPSPPRPSSRPRKPHTKEAIPSA